jgi:tetratricopeptide (TPR) repeat protein
LPVFSLTLRQENFKAGKVKFRLLLELGKEITSEYDFSFLKEMNRNEAIITKAFSDIEQNQDKVFYSLFWFNNINSIDNTAIQHLKAGNKENAIEIWNKITQDKEVTPQNFSAFNNLGTIYLESELEEEIRFGIETKIKLIQSDNFKNFVNTVADETFIINQNNQVELFVDALLSEFKNKYSTTETIALFNNGDESVQKYLSKKFTEEPIHQIEKKLNKLKTSV